MFLIQFGIYPVRLIVRTGSYKLQSSGFLLEKLWSTRYVLLYVYFCSIPSSEIGCLFCVKLNENKVDFLGGFFGFLLVIRWDGTEDIDNDETGQPRYLSDVPSCPCNVEQVELDVGRFMPQTGGCADDADDPSCTRETGSERQCFFSTKAV